MTILLFLQSQADSAVTSFLNRKLPSYVVLSYDDIRVNFITGKISIENVKVDILNRDGKDTYAQVTMDRLAMEGFSYWRFWLINTIHAGKLSMKDPIFKIYPYLKKQSADKSTEGVVDLKKDIFLEAFELSNGSLYMMQEKEDSLHMSALAINFKVINARIDTDIILKKIPIEYEGYILSGRNIFIDLNPYEKLNLAQLSVDNNTVRMENFSIHSKYSQSALFPLLNEEREHLSIDFPNIHLSGLEYGFNKETFFMKISKAAIHAADVVVHLDKRKEDRTEVHTMYSKTLRDLPIQLGIDSVVISDSRIVYEEKINPETEAGRIFFDKVQANILQVSNTYPQGQKTKAHASALFMGTSPITLDCDFDINNKQDPFRASGSVAQFNSSSVNQFLTSNLSVRAEGEVDRLFFTISGDEKSSSGDMKAKYENFSFQILKNDRIRVKKLMTVIGNVLVNSGEQTDMDGYRHGKISVERNPHKSFFNYLWINVSDGLKNVMTGNGKKEG